MTRLIDGYCRLLEWTIALVLAVMVVLVFGNVVLRYAFNSGITVSEEVSRWLCLVTAQLLMLWATWLLFSGGLAQARINLDVEAPVTGASVAIFYSAGIVFAVSAGLLLVREIWRTVSGQTKDSDLVMVQESEDLAAVQALHIDETPPIGQGPNSMPFRR